MHIHIYMASTAPHRPLPALGPSHRGPRLRPRLQPSHRGSRLRPRLQPSHRGSRFAAALNGIVATMLKDALARTLVVRRLIRTQLRRSERTNSLAVGTNLIPAFTEKDKDKEKEKETNKEKENYKEKEKNKDKEKDTEKEKERERKRNILKETEKEP